MVQLDLLILACASANVSNDVRMSLQTSCMFCFNIGLDKPRELDCQLNSILAGEDGQSTYCLRPYP